MTTRKVLSSLTLVIASFLFSIMSVYAGSTTLSLSGASSVIVGNNVEVTINISNITDVSGGIAGFEALVNYDPEYLQYVSKSALAPFGISYSDSVKKISGAAMDAESRIGGSSASLIKLVFKTKKEGTTSVSLSSTEVSEGNNAIASSNNPSKTITITPPPSTNANLSSLSISSGSISFNKDTTSYSVNVGSDVTSINVTAQAEDSGAKVAGIGTKNLNYGANAISVVVTAPSGAKKTYTINVNREDNRSKNNNLSSLKINTGTLSPNFNANTTNYSVSVPFDISSIKVDATAADSKSKVVVTGGSTLKAGAVTTITVKVTAENGAVKTYYVRVTRGKDPNAPKSNNSYLSEITLTEGLLLDPTFKKDILEYTVNVENNISKIELVGVPEDALASVKVEGPNSLKIGENEYKIIVTAEDESTTKTYIIKVIRAEGEMGNEPDNDSSEENIEDNNNLLKEINLTNGNLTTKFDSKKFVYYYKKNKNFQIDALPILEDNKVTIIEHDSVITIIVGEDLNDANIYTLIPKTSNILLIVASVISGSLITTGSFLLYKSHIKKGKKKKSVKKNKNEA